MLTGFQDFGKKGVRLDSGEDCARGREAGGRCVLRQRAEGAPAVNAFGGMATRDPVAGYPLPAQTELLLTSPCGEKAVHRLIIGAALISLPLLLPPPAHALAMTDEAKAWPARTTAPVMAANPKGSVQLLEQLKKARKQKGGGSGRR
jgi:hypothetical protein